MQKLHDDTIYHYDKIKGFSVYDPLEYKHNGYTIDKLYQLYLHTKEKLDEALLKEGEIKKWGEAQGIHVDDVLDVTKHDLLTQFDQVSLIEKDKHGYVLRLRNLRSNEFLTKVLVQTPEDLETGVYKLNGGKFDKDKNKEEQLWNIL